MRERRFEHGLTLVEMLVVLTILVMLAGVAMTATEGLVEQARFDATRRTLENIEEAILGPHGLRSPDDTPLITGFVADMGGLPLALEELWAPTATPFSFTGSAVDVDAQVQLPRGWRGPYVRLPLGTTMVRDGWGNELVPDTAAGLRILSFGSDGVEGGTGYAEDVPLILSSTAQQHHVGDVRFNVVAAPTTTASIVVRLFAPVRTTTGTVEIRVIGQRTFGPADERLGTFRDRSIGPRAIRAYRIDGLPAVNPDAEANWNVAFDSADVEAHSRPVDVSIKSGALTTVKLDIHSP